MCATLALQTRQSLTLTPRLQQSLRLLQLSSLELQQELRAALDTNPFLEEAPSADGENPATTATDADYVARPQDAPSAEYESATEAGGAQSSEESAQDDSVFTRDGSDFYDPAQMCSRKERRLGIETSDSDPADWMSVQPTLREQLHGALCLYQLGGRAREVARIVIDALDDDGYLRQDLADLAGALRCLPPLTESELLIALRLVQSLDRPGIGARSLSECLLLQLDALDADVPGRQAACEIAAHYLGHLARREMAELQKRVDCNSTTLRDACSLLRSLDPRPGNHYGRADNAYIVPDLIVHRVGSRWTVTTNPAVMPRARIHRLYAALFAQSTDARRSPLAEQLQEARWLIRNVRRRLDTIQRVGECIVAHQYAFFQYGGIALKPLVLRDIATELDLHESTVSRATANKYMATPQGTFSFRLFFPRELETETGGTCSSEAVRVLLKEMIAGEDVHEPLTDVTLARLLGEQGVKVARRTVTKYRNLMKMPPADVRKRY